MIEGKAAGVRAALERDGFSLIRGACREEHLRALDCALDQICSAAPAGRASAPGLRHVHRLSSVLSGAAWLDGIREHVDHVLGPDWGLVRSVYFEKAGGGWALPWHRDRAIAVVAAPGATMLGGVPHVVAEDRILAELLAVRIHLDDASRLNGALEVRPGSHLEPRTSAPHVVEAARGDVLLMRPLLEHRSGSPQAGAASRRRVLHLELAPASLSIAPFRWHDFVLPPGRA